MKQISFKILAALLNNADTRLGLKALEKALTWGVPFNVPHGFKFLKLNTNEAVMKLPFKKVNKNHLGTAHACAIATLGEFPAGVFLIKHFSPERFRVVMTELNVVYEKPGIGDLIGASHTPLEELGKAKLELSNQGHANITGHTKIINSKNETVATVTTQWQLKEWEQTKHR